MVNNNAVAIAPTLTSLHCTLVSGTYFRMSPNRMALPVTETTKSRMASTNGEIGIRPLKNFVTASRAVLARREAKSMKAMLMTIPNEKMRWRNSCQIYSANL